MKNDKSPGNYGITTEEMNSFGMTLRINYLIQERNPLYQVSCLLPRNKL